MSRAITWDVVMEDPSAAEPRPQVVKRISGAKLLDVNVARVEAGQMHKPLRFVSAEAVNPDVRPAPTAVGAATATTTEKRKPTTKATNEQNP